MLDSFAGFEMPVPHCAEPREGNERSAVGAQV